MARSKAGGMGVSCGAMVPRVGYRGAGGLET
jgi:hypothetical protein